ncbi:unnamed protein product, partial [Rotaria magnacalcarata]
MVSLGLAARAGKVLSTPDEG